MNENNSAWVHTLHTTVKCAQTAWTIYKIASLASPGRLSRLVLQYSAQPAANWIAQQTGISAISTITSYSIEAASFVVDPINYTIRTTIENCGQKLSVYTAETLIEILDIESEAAKSVLRIAVLEAGNRLSGKVTNQIINDRPKVIPKESASASDIPSSSHPLPIDNMPNQNTINPTKTHTVPFQYVPPSMSSISENTLQGNLSPIISLHPLPPPSASPSKMPTANVNLSNCHSMFFKRAQTSNINAMLQNSANFLLTLSEQFLKHRQVILQALAEVEKIIEERRIKMAEFERLKKQLLKDHEDALQGIRAEAAKVYREQCQSAAARRKRREEELDEMRQKLEKLEEELRNIDARLAKANKELKNLYNLEIQECISNILITIRKYIDLKEDILLQLKRILLLFFNKNKLILSTLNGKDGYSNFILTLSQGIIEYMDTKKLDNDNEFVEHLDKFLSTYTSALPERISPANSNNPVARKAIVMA